MTAGAITRLANATMRKFGYPETLVGETEAWVVLVRPQQVPLGALVLACKEPATAFSELSPAAFADLATAVAGVERLLKSRFAFDKINYLMLMMVDPDVHFHVIPRYASTRSFAGVEFPDTGWPRTPELGAPTPLAADGFQQLVNELRAGWASAAG